MHTLTVQHLHKTYRQRKGNDSAVVAIADLDFTVEPGQIVAIVGRTGCGKSTFLRLMLGLEEPSRGRIMIDDFEPYKSFERGKGVVGAIFQEDRLLPWRTAIDNATLGMEILGIPRAEQLERAREWLGILGLSKYHDAYPSELSGGMRQRVALARAFTIRPKVLLADEAFGHLDEVTANELRGEFLKLVEQTGSTTIFVTHQLNEALYLGHRVLVFDRPARIMMDFDSRELSAVDQIEVKKEMERLIGSDRPTTSQPDNGRRR